MNQAGGNGDFLTFLEPAFRRCADDKAFVTVDGQRVSYRRMNQIVIAFAARIHKLGLRAGECVVVDVRNDFATLCLQIALSSLGITLVLTGNMRQAVKAGCRIDAVIATHPKFATADRTIPFTQEWFDAEEADIAATPQVGFTADRGHCVISSSAGTTGTPKYLGLTYEIMANRALSYDGYLSNQAPKRLTTFGPGINVGFLSHLSTLKNGGTIYRPRGSAAETLELIDAEGIDEVFTTSNLLADLVEAQSARGSSTKTLSRAVVGGSRISISLLRRTKQILSDDVYIGYGSAEAGGTAVCRFDEDSHIEGLVGPVYEGVRVVCVDDDDNELPAGETGAIRIAAPSSIAVSSYLGDIPDGDGVFRDGWFYPGDMGYLTGNGAPVITGRTDNVINLGGNKVSCEQLEDLCARHEHVVKACVFGLRNAEGFDDIAIAVVGSPEFKVSDLETFVRAHTRMKERIHIEVLDAFPANRSDKVDRAGVREMFLNLRQA